MSINMNFDIFFRFLILSYIDNFWTAHFHEIRKEMLQIIVEDVLQRLQVECGELEC